MDRLRSKEQLKDYTKMMLGHPAIKVNLSDQQIYACIDRAVKLVNKRVWGGSYESYVVFTVSDDDYKNGYLILPDENIEEVLEVVPNFYFGMSPDSVMSMANPSMTGSMEFSGNGTTMMSSISIVDYEMAAQGARYLVAQKLGGRDFEYIRPQLKLIPKFKYRAGDTIAARINIVIDPTETENSMFYDDEYVKELTEAYANQVWGGVLEKFQGTPLAGGVTIDGSRLVQKGRESEQLLLRRIKLETTHYFTTA